MPYNLTDSQKHLVRWIVQSIRDGSLGEEFQVVWVTGDSGEIMHFDGDHPDVSKSALDVLCQADLLTCRANFQAKTSTTGRMRPVTTTRETEINRICAVTQRAYEAVDTDFSSPPHPPPSLINIGPIVHTMTGGSIQAVGISLESQVSQIVNDPDLLRSQLAALSEQLVAEVGSALEGEVLEKYVDAARQLKEELGAQQPDSSRIRWLIRTLALLGDIEGSFGLMVRVWSILHPLLLIAAALSQ